MNTPTLSQLADIGAAAAAEQFASEQDDSVSMYILSAAVDYAIDAPAREAFVKAVLGAVGYKFPVDPEREAFDAWVKEATCVEGGDRLFEAWKAGRDNLREASGKTQAAKPPPETFEAQGLTWFKHTPGDPCPCDGTSAINCLFGGQSSNDDPLEVHVAARKYWGVGDYRFYPLIGWRYAYATPPADTP